MQTMSVRILNGGQRKSSLGEGSKAAAQLFGLGHKQVIWNPRWNSGMGSRFIPIIGHGPLMVCKRGLGFKLLDPLLVSNRFF